MTNSAQAPEDFCEITPTANIGVTTHGGRAKCLQRLVRLDMPVPLTLALSFGAVKDIAEGRMPDTARMMASFGDAPLVCVRPSSQDPDWGGPRAVLNVGINDARHADLCKQIGKEAANVMYLRFVKEFAVHVARLDPDMFEAPKSDSAQALAHVLNAYELETDTPFPQDPAVQLAQVLRSMARAWDGTTARLLRSASGAPADAGLGLIVQKMALGVGPGESGSGRIHFVDAVSGKPAIVGRYTRQSQQHETEVPENTLYIGRDPRGPSFQDEVNDVFNELVDWSGILRQRLREEMQVEFTVEQGALCVLDAIRVQRSSRAGVAIAVALANDGIITRNDALLRTQPHALSELLHPQIDPSADRSVCARGIAASPGAATGRLVFDSATAQANAARGEASVLVRRETTPEDIRGMHAASAVLTEKGGVTSHAAVIARGLGVPCIVGATDIKIDSRKKQILTQDGRVLSEGETMTIDGTSGEILFGAAKMVEAAQDGAFRSLLSWADDVREIGVRANADTPADAAVAHNFEAEGIGLCRTEHMFFEQDRLTVMREMIFADSSADRHAALDRLLPMQRNDFIDLFDIMAGKPVCIRLFDLPLHEILPATREGLHDLAEALDRPLSEVTQRVDAISEFNPMLGMRGVRLGIEMPEIYVMQARAIFEAAIEMGRRGTPFVPEIMIPLVSAKREVELVKTQIDGVAAELRAHGASDFDYRLGVMVETPRAALRAGDIAMNASFLSFGTNDLTQMTYGLSRDDAGRFMSGYVQKSVFPEDPFHMLDHEGVGELMEIGAARARAARPNIVLSMCGEHGGNPESIAFCCAAGFDYVSCSPFRVPVARLAAAHLAISQK